MRRRNWEEVRPRDILIVRFRVKYILKGGISKDVQKIIDFNDSFCDDAYLGWGSISG